jgi:hypothetical protein
MRRCAQVRRSHGGRTIAVSCCKRRRRGKSLRIRIAVCPSERNTYIAFFSFKICRCLVFFEFAGTYTRFWLFLRFSSIFLAQIPPLPYPSIQRVCNVLSLPSRQDPVRSDTFGGESGSTIRQGVNIKGDEKEEILEKSKNKKK